MPHPRRRLVITAPRMWIRLPPIPLVKFAVCCVGFGCLGCISAAAQSISRQPPPAHDAAAGQVVGTFVQEVAVHFERQSGLPGLDIKSVSLSSDDEPLAHTVEGTVVWRGGRWQPAADAPPDASSGLPSGVIVQQTARGPDGTQAAATNRGLFEQRADGEWQKLMVLDGLGRIWAAEDVRGVAYDATGSSVVRQLGRSWPASERSAGDSTKARTACRTTISLVARRRPTAVSGLELTRARIRFREGRMVLSTEACVGCRTTTSVGSWSIAATPSGWQRPRAWVASSTDR